MRFELVLLGIMLGAMSMFAMLRITDDPFTQAHFPCHEDEVLGYVPGNFTHVECIHVDVLGWTTAPLP